MKRMYMKVEVKGFYGHGNLGDDLLMIVSYRFIRELFELPVEILKTDKTYIMRLIPEYTEYPNKTIEKIIKIDGGGGIFFGLRKDKFYNIIFNTIIKLIGAPQVLRILQSLGKRQLSQIDINMSLCIGIGPYKK